MNIYGLTTGLAIFVSLFLNGCSISGIAGNNVSVDGNDGEATVKKSVKITDFNEIEASQAIKVVYVQGKNTGIAEISTTPSAEKYLKVEVKDKILKVYYANTENIKNVRIKGPSIIKVSSPLLNEVDLSSTANVTIEGDLKLKGNFELDLSSASSFNARNISCAKFDADLSSSASAKISNLNGNLEADLSSASSINFEKVKGNVDLETSSSASITIDALTASTISAEASSAGSISISGISGGSISASASSGAKINLSGKADTLSKDVSSGGSVNHSNLTLLR